LLVSGSVLIRQGCSGRCDAAEGVSILFVVDFTVFIRAFRLPDGDGVELHLHGEFEDKLGTLEEIDDALREVNVCAGVEVTVEGDGLDADDVIVPGYGVFGWWVVEELGEDVVGDHFVVWVRISLASAYVVMFLAFFRKDLNDVFCADGGEAAAASFIMP